MNKDDNGKGRGRGRGRGKGRGRDRATNEKPVQRSLDEDFEAVAPPEAPSTPIQPKADPPSRRRTGEKIEDPGRKRAKHDESDQGSGQKRNENKRKRSAQPKARTERKNIKDGTLQQLQSRLEVRIL